MSDDKKTDKRFSLQSYQGILHVCEDVLNSYRMGTLEKKDVDAMMSLFPDKPFQTKADTLRRRTR